MIFLVCCTNVSLTNPHNKQKHFSSKRLFDRFPFSDPLYLPRRPCFFRQNHEHLCDHSLHLREGLDSAGASGLSGALPHSLPSTPDIENAQLTPILPFLYLGNEQDAQDLHQLQRLNISFILNVTTHLPLYHYDTGLFSYKRLPATDSNKQNLRQYFEEAFEFIGMYRASTVLLSLANK